MRKGVVALCLPLASLPVMAQQGAAPGGMDGMATSRQLESAGRIRLLVPKDLPAENREETKRLLKELHQACPSCADGGTVGTAGGQVIVGPRVGWPNSAGQVLWSNGSGTAAGSTTPYITIPRSEYDSLKHLARKYDALLKKLGTAP